MTLLSLEQLNRATLARQMLLRREPVDVVTAVARVLALQAQSAPSPYIALWNRVRDFDAADLDRGYADHRVIKATLMRATLHAVTAADHPALHHAMAGMLRATRLGNPTFASLGVPATDADAVLDHVLDFAEQGRTNAEIEAVITERLGPLPTPGLWWALRSYAPVVHAPTGGPWSYSERPSYLASPTQPFDGAREESLAHLVFRYLEAFGPASEADAARFAKLARKPTRDALAALGDRLESHQGEEGTVLFDVVGGPLPPADTPAPPRLMAMWDSTLLAFDDRRRVIADEYRPLVIRTNGDTLPTLLVDGRVAGVWRTCDGGIEATAFHRLTDEEWAGLAAEAASLVRFLAPRGPVVYRRYARWWSHLPAAEVRVLPG